MIRHLPFRWAAAVMVAALLSGCAGLSYYLQSAHGHFSVLHAARPIEDVLADPQAAPGVKARLQQVVAIRSFASRALALPDNASYRRYADLQRPFVLWNVFATPELSLRMRQWCFPVVGCVAYRGYYDKADAEREAAQLHADGWEINVAGVPAYSTLGYFDDPVLNTFIGYPEGELARLVFHELAHQVAYAKNDTTFNESFATAVEEVGVDRWLALPENAHLRAPYAQFAERRRDFIALLKRYRGLLEELYGSARALEEKRRGKAALFQALRDDYARLKAEKWGGYAGYDAWFARPLNNAHLAAVGTYTDLVPAFRQLLQAHGGDLPAFYRTVQDLARKPQEERTRILARYGASAGGAAARLPWAGGISMMKNPAAQTHP